MNNLTTFDEEVDLGQTLNKIDLLIQSKNFDEALKICLKLEKNFSHDANVNFKIAIVYKNLSKLDLAIKYYNKVIEIKPDQPDALNNLGNILNHKGEVERASSLFLKVILLMPNAVQPYSNLSYSCYLIKQFSDSIKYGLKAIELNPNLIQTYIHVALSQNSMGDFDQALQTLSKALTIDSNSDNIWNTYDLLLSNAKFTKYDFSLDKTIEKLFEKKVLSSASINTLLNRIEYHPDISNLSYNLKNEEISEDLLETIQKLKNVPCLFRILTEIIVKNKKIEFVLTTIRKKILFSLNKFQDNEIVVALQSLITFQCFNNEYVYFQTNKETKITDKIENELKIKAENNESLPTLKLLSLGSYINIGHLSWSRLISHDEQNEWILKEIVSNTLLEKAIKNHLPILKPISDHTSKLVEIQYSDNPYPKWINHKSNKEVTFKDFIKKEKIKLINVNNLQINHPSVLIAGCGTGVQAMNLAQKFPSSNILAVDLSADSLAYGLRKSKEVNINNINFVKGDILDLGGINKNFDIIECTGVLHHMKHPKKGLKSLLDNLNKEGILKLGLYSKLARCEINKFRDLMERQNLKFSNDFVRKLRYQMFTKNNNDYKEFVRIPYLNDFYSMSGIRDLLFHIQEQNFTILDIKNILDEYNLHFGGFVFGDKSHLTRFKKMFPSKDSEYNLNNWNEFELKFGTTFLSMYQFWVQKI